MTRNFDVDRALDEWLAEGPSQLPDRAIDAIVRQLNDTDQRRPTWLPGRVGMNRFVFALGGAAAVVVFAVLALGLYANRPGVGGLPSRTPSASPTVAASPAVEPTVPPSSAASPRSHPEGELAPGTYAAHPLAGVRRSIAEPNESLTVTFTVPDGWEFVTNVLAPAGDPGVGPPGGVSIQFFDVYTVNGDPCRETDVMSVGPTVNDLVETLRAQTAYEVSEPVDVTIGGYSGKRLDIVQPTAGCDHDNSRFRMWTATSLGISDGHYAHGPANRWQANILDVDGTRLVVAATDFPDTSPADRAEMDAILESIVIEP